MSSAWSGPVLASSRARASSFVYLRVTADKKREQLPMTFDEIRGSEHPRSSSNSGRRRFASRTRKLAGSTSAAPPSHVDSERKDGDQTRGSDNTSAHPRRPRVVTSGELSYVPPLRDSRVFRGATADPMSVTTTSPSLLSVAEAAGRAYTLDAMGRVVAFAMSVSLMGACTWSPVTSTPAPTSSGPATRPAAVVSAAPTDEPQDPQGTGIEWEKYRSDALAITLEYPAASRTRGPLPRCAPHESGMTITLDRLTIRADTDTQFHGATPDAAADAFVASGAGFSSFRITGRAPVTIGGGSGVRVDFMDFSHVGTIAFARNDGRAFELTWWQSGPFDCEPTRGFSAPQVYEHVLGSVAFLVPARR